MKLNTINLKTIALCLATFSAFGFFSSCSEKVTDFGFDGQISGMILDQNGNAVSGDASNAALTVYALGTEDRVPLEIRVNGDGSYANTHLYPQSYKIWIEGPVDAPAEQTIDLTGGAVNQDIVVTPFLAIRQPSASISAGEISVSYEINPSQNHVAEERIVLISTVAKVGIDTGDGPRWQTREIALDNNSGTASLVLDSELLNMSRERGGGNLHVRVAARSNNSTQWNYSLPIVIKP